MIRAETSEIFSLNLIILMDFKFKVSEYSITQMTGQELQGIHNFLIEHRDGVTCFLIPHRRDVASEETNGKRKA